MEIHKLFTPISSFVNKNREAIVDNKVFRLHTILTPAIYLTFTLTYSLKEYVGDPISCLGHPNSHIDIAIANLYCWTKSTYSVVEYFRPRESKLAISPGVGPLNSWNTVIFHRYYLWLPFFFLLLSLTTYAPRYIWKHQLEGDYMKMLKEKLDTPIIDEEDKRTRISLLGDYLIETLGFNNLYAIAFFACEFLNFIITIVTFYFADRVINYQFSTYGWDVACYFWQWGICNPEYGKGTLNPMDTVLPKLTKCQLSYTGPGGGIMPLDYVCTLALNNFNDKIFLFLWFYIIFLGTISAFTLLWRIFLVFSTRARAILLQRCLLRFRCPLRYDRLVAKLALGDWFVLTQLEKNIDKLAFVDLLDVLNHKLIDDDATVV